MAPRAPPAGLATPRRGEVSRRGSQERIKPAVERATPRAGRPSGLPEASVARFPVNRKPFMYRVSLSPHADLRLFPGSLRAIFTRPSSPGTTLEGARRSYPITLRAI
jgi:hypothetical protein